MRRESQIPQPSQNQHFQEISNLLIPRDLKFSRINTSKKSQDSRIPFIPINFNSPRINTSENKHLKSFRINTSKKQGRGVGVSPEWIRRIHPSPSVAVHSRPGLWRNFVVDRVGAKLQVTPAKQSGRVRGLR